MTNDNDSPFDDRVYEVIGPKPGVLEEPKGDVVLNQPAEDPLDEQLRVEEARAEFLESMERERVFFEAKLTAAAIGWADNITSLRHCQALQEAVIKLRTFDRDYLRKYVKKFTPDADDGFVRYLNELEEKLG